MDPELPLSEIWPTFGNTSPAVDILRFFKIAKGDLLTRLALLRLESEFDQFPIAQLLARQGDSEAELPIKIEIDDPYWIGKEIEDGIYQMTVTLGELKIPVRFVSKESPESVLFKGEWPSALRRALSNSEVIEYVAQDTCERTVMKDDIKPAQASKDRL